MGYIKNQIKIQERVDVVDRKVYTREYILMNRAKIFTNGQSQAIRLPKEFRFKGKEVYIKRIGANVVLSPIEDSIDRFWNTLNGFKDITIERNQPLESDKREQI